MENIVFNNGLVINWQNNSGSIVTWQNNSSVTVVWNTYNLNYSVRMADFVRVATGTTTTATAMTIGNTYTIKDIGTTNFVSCGASSNTVGTTFVCTAVGTGTGLVTTTTYYRFSTAPTAMTISAVDSQPFAGLSALVNIGDVTRDIKSTANETTITLVGLDSSLLGWALGQNIKGSKIEMWHGFFDADNNLITTGGTGGLYKFFTGYVNSFQISEQWIEEARSYTGVISVNASSIQIILQNSVSGRFTNNNSWTFFDSTDTSMARVGFIETINYAFGATNVPTITASSIKSSKIPTEL